MYYEAGTTYNLAGKGEGDFGYCTIRFWLEGCRDEAEGMATAKSMREAGTRGRGL